MIRSETEVQFRSENVVFNPQEFLIDFSNESRRAKRRVYAQCMTFEADHVGMAFSHSITEASSRGLDVRMKIDHWVNMVTADLPNFALPFIPNSDGWREHLKFQNSELIHQLSNSGVDLEITNKEGPVGDLGFALGRNHRKIFIVDDILYFGGVNISEAIFSRVDFMIKIHDKDIVNAVADFFVKQDSVGNSNTVINLGDTALLIDSGKEKSLISQKAQRLASQAKDEIILMTPTTPDFKLAKNILQAAKRGVRVRTYTTLKKDNSCFESHAPDRGRTHAKLLMVDDTAIFGSHNFNWYSNLGTQELSIITSRRTLTEPLRKYFESKILETS